MAYDTQNAQRRPETLDEVVGYAERAFFRPSHRAGLGDHRRDRILNLLLDRVEQKLPFAIEAGELLVRAKQDGGLIVNGQVEHRYEQVMKNRPRFKPAPNKVPRRTRTPEEKAAARKRLESNRRDRAVRDQGLTKARIGSKPSK